MNECDILYYSSFFKNLIFVKYEITTLQSLGEQITQQNNCQRVCCVAWLSMWNE